MMAADSQPYIEAADSSAPAALRNPVPVWIFIILFVLLYWGMVVLRYFRRMGANRLSALSFGGRIGIVPTAAA